MTGARCNTCGSLDIAEPGADEVRAGLNDAIDTLARHRLHDAVLEIDHVIAEIRAGGTISADELLDVRNRLNGPAS